MPTKAMQEYLNAQAKKRSFSSDSASFISVQMEPGFENEEIKKILKQTTTSMKNMANAYYKQGTFLEVSDIEQIKLSLKNYTACDSKAIEFKKSLIDDLAVIQKKIESKHIEKLKKMIEEKALCEKQTRVLEFEKNKLIMDRLSKIQWPYDSKTQEYDNKITGLKAKLESLIRKIEETRKLKPAACEKDILIYQIELKEKYAA